MKLSRKETIVLGKWTEDKINSLLKKSSRIVNIGKRIEFLSRFFLGVPYKNNTLIGDKNNHEIFVINLQAVDCFTFVDYIESMRLSDSFERFKATLKCIRYKNSKVLFKNRNHFFTDWKYFNQERVFDITERLLKTKSIRVYKTLNLKNKNKNTFFIKGIKKIKREIFYLPTGLVSANIIRKLKTGDYIGIYTDKDGLDVCHLGILIKSKGNVYLRHACSLDNIKKVMDEDFRQYIASKKGIVILRPI